MKLYPLTTDYSRLTTYDIFVRGDCPECEKWGEANAAQLLTGRGHLNYSEGPCKIHLERSNLVV